MLSDGHTTAEVAREVGCSRQHVWRILRRSRALYWAIAEAETEAVRDANARLAGLRPLVADALARGLDEGNVRVTLWLADRLGLGCARNGRALPPPEDDDPLDPETLIDGDDDAAASNTLP
jgi:AcrR family transcriptional regulator